MNSPLTRQRAGIALALLTPLLFSAADSVVRHLNGSVPVVAIMTVRGYAVPVLCCAFVLGGPARYFYERVVLKRAQRESLF